MKHQAVGKSNLNHAGQTSVSTSEGLFTAFFVTMMFHLFIIFGISFGVTPLSKKQPSQTMDIVLVHSEAEKPPETPDYLAQADQMGGGNTAEKAKPTSTAPGEAPTQGNALQNKPETAAKPVVQKAPKKSLLSTQKHSEHKAAKLSKKEKIKPKEQTKLTTTDISQLQQKIIDIEAELAEKKNAIRQTPQSDLYYRFDKKSA